MQLRPVFQEEPRGASGALAAAARSALAASTLHTDTRKPIAPNVPHAFFRLTRLKKGRIGRHVLSCEKVLAQDLARFETAFAAFTLDPSRAREVVETFVNRVRRNWGLDVDERSL